MCGCDWLDGVRQKMGGYAVLLHHLPLRGGAGFPLLHAEGVTVDNHPRQAKRRELEIRHVETGAVNVDGLE